MVFSSPLFLCYFLPAFLGLYWLAPRFLKNAVALAASLLFYAWGGLPFLGLFLGSVVVNFFLIRGMAAEPIRWRQRIYLLISVVLNVAMLFYFKYANFFIENVGVVQSYFGGSALSWQKVVLPIGISFFTFEKLTYTIDVYRGVNKPLRSFWDFLLYIMLFPKLIAGPIVRFHEIAGQLDAEGRRPFETIDHKLAGLFRFTLGLAKKVLIANVLGEQADRIFALDPRTLPLLTAWAGAVSYSLQIYFDFSGYSDMALGLGRLIGFQFPENFNSPYISRSITEFWQRWHITLGRWMRDYLYIPLGGNRVRPSRLYVNLWTVFILSGFWHGAAWTFLAWGAYHGLFLVLERLFLLRVYQRLGWFSLLLTLVVTVFGWVLFRADTLAGALRYWQALVGLNPGPRIANLYFGPEFTYTLGLAAVASLAAALPGVARWELGQLAATPLSRGGAWRLSAGTALLLVLSLSYLVGSSFNPFIYFRF
jgi:alginate O-acetyltransferase complex protein AlgI